jgi:putative salt-induced outer membrane protein YdiY
MCYRILAAFLCVVAMGTKVSADVVVLTNGDRLTGKVVHLKEGKMVLKSTLAGEVTINLSDIATFGTDEPIEVHLADGTVLKQKVESTVGGQFRIAGDKLVKQQDFSVSAISSINPPPTAWHGDISAGLAATRGNTVTDRRNIDMNLLRRSDKDRTIVKGYYIESKQEDPDTGDKETTEDEWMIEGTYDYFFTKKMFGFVNGRYEKDAIADLDRRVILGGGAGYQWVESEEMNFSTRAGLASLYEKYDTQTDSTTELSAQVGYHFDKKLGRKFKFINDLTYYPSLEEISDYFLTTTAELRASITERMFTNFKVMFDYDSTPAQGAHHTDVKYIFGVGLNF